MPVQVGNIASLAHSDFHRINAVPWSGFRDTFISLEVTKVE